MISNSEITSVKTEDTCSFPITLYKEYHFSISARNYIKIPIPESMTHGSFIQICGSLPICTF